MVLVVRPNVVVNHRSESIGLMPPYDASDIATYQPSQAWQILQYTVYYLIVGNFAYIRIHCTGSVVQTNMVGTEDD